MTITAWKMVPKILPQVCVPYFLLLVAGCRTVDSIHTSDVHYRVLENGQLKNYKIVTVSWHTWIPMGPGNVSRILVDSETVDKTRASIWRLIDSASRYRLVEPFLRRAVVQMSFSPCVMHLNAERKACWLIANCPLVVAIRREAGPIHVRRQDAKSNVAAGSERQSLRLADGASFHEIVDTLIIYSGSLDPGQVDQISISPAALHILSLPSGTSIGDLLFQGNTSAELKEPLRQMLKGSCCQ